MNKDDFAQYLKQVTMPLFSLISQVPEDKLEWTPPGAKFMPMGALIRHLAVCPMMISIIVKNQFPDAASMQKMIAENDNHRATPEEAKNMLQQNLDQALKDLAALSQDDYNNLEVVAPFGTMKMWRMLLAGSEHLINHKTQLFLYLKMLGRPVGWMNLMRG